LTSGIEVISTRLHIPPLKIERPMPMPHDDNHHFPENATKRLATLKPRISYFQRAVKRFGSPSLRPLTYPPSVVERMASTEISRSRAGKVQSPEEVRSTAIFRAGLGEEGMLCMCGCGEGREGDMRGLIGGLDILISTLIVASMDAIPSDRW
jgi:hypothetical protein